MPLSVAYTKIRIDKASSISSYLFFAALNAPLTKRQIRSKQFTADIIDTIGGRFSELVLPIPKDIAICKSLEERVKHAAEKRNELRENIRRIPLLAEGLIGDLSDDLPENTASLSEQSGNPGFLITLKNIKNGIFMPKYYDPRLEHDIAALAKTHKLVPVRDLIKNKILSWSTGIKIGKMAYGTGNIPFIRTSDITNWELKSDPKQNVSEDIYEENKQDVQAQDILVVRDGTYLVGSSCILTEHDTRVLYCGGLYKLRIQNGKEIDPYLLLALLNTPIVRRQMRAKQFTRDIIDTLGNRLFEVFIPVPKAKRLRDSIASFTRETVETRVNLRNEAKRITTDIESTSSSDTDFDVIDELEPILT